MYWTPRIIVILFALFISLFALDVFDENRSTWETILALLLHLIPTAIIIGSLFIAWKWELFGAFFYPALGVIYIIWAWGKFPVITYLTISGPVVIIGILFFLSWNYHRRQKQKPDEETIETE